MKKLIQGGHLMCLTSESSRILASTVKVESLCFSPTQNSIPWPCSVPLHHPSLLCFCTQGYWEPSWPRMSAPGEPPLATPFCSFSPPHTCSRDHLLLYLHLTIHLSPCPLTIKLIFLHFTETSLSASRPKSLIRTILIIDLSDPISFSSGFSSGFYLNSSPF